MKSIQTTMTVSADVAEIWDKVCFYEEVEGTPTWFLRMVLPLPLRTVGDHKTVGTICRCEYSEGQHILKKITASVENDLLAFDVVETTERFARHIRLKGGTIRVAPTPQGGAVVTMVTDYEPNRGVGMLRSALIFCAIRAMHRFVIRDMAAAIRADAAGAVAARPGACHL